MHVEGMCVWICEYVDMWDVWIVYVREDRDTYGKRYVDIHDLSGIVSRFLFREPES